MNSTTFVHEGVVFDLTIPYADVTGGEWMWTGGWAQGEPLMRHRSDRGDCQTPLRFTVVYWDLGPLIPISPRPTPAQYRAAIDPNYAATVAAGYVEDHIVAAVAPVLTAHHLPPSPLEQSGFRRFIRSLQKGGA
ncbi:phiSA1p31-related protein [Streptomyces sp. NPDC057552]|uniref:phiSA1p31-related protein n=1 Tax=Streptomyces sp. NPDC057552 TaxID=3350537 RepID=UPI00368C9C61